MSQAPPQNLEAEESVLGAMMLSPAAIEAAGELLKPSDFYRKSHGLIFEAAMRLAERSENVDTITLADELESRGKLGEAGGKHRLAEIATLVPVSANAPHHARIVKKMAGLRGLIQAGTQIAQLGRENNGDLDELIARAEQALGEGIAPTVTSNFQPLPSDIDSLLDEIRDAIRTGQPRVGLQTGFVDLDRRLTGFHPGQLILIAARPGMGKSALALNIAENVADNGTLAAIASLEMSRLEIQLRSLSRLSNLSTSIIRTGQIKQEHFERFAAATKKVKERTLLHIEDRSDITPAQLRAEARRLHRREGLGLLIVDYLQLMLAGRTEDSRQQEVASISRSLKVLARELNIPVVALSQLSRKLESRDQKRPMLSDLRDSGALEQDADVVLFIYREDQYEADSQKQGEAEIIIGKNRMGEGGTVKLAFSGRSSSFKNLATGVM